SLPLWAGTRKARTSGRDTKGAACKIPTIKRQPQTGRKTGVRRNRKRVRKAADATAASLWTGESQLSQKSPPFHRGRGIDDARKSHIDLRREVSFEVRSSS